MIFFTQYPLTDLLETIVDNRGKTVPTVNSGFPLIATNCIKDSSIYPTFENIRFVSEETLATWFRAELKPNDILFVNKGTPGKVCLVPNPVSFCAAQDMIGLRCNPNRVYYKYLFAYLRTPFVQKKIKHYHVGIMIPHFKKSDLDNLIISLPDMQSQKHIGDFYVLLSEKIEINKHIISELESLAKTIYDYWFLQFDFPDDNGKPYKSSGGKMVWNEELKREIPDGWDSGNLFDIAYFVNGLACQNFRPIDDVHRLPVVKIVEMHNGISNDTEWVRDDINEKHIIDSGDILFSWSASLETMIWNGGHAGLNQHIFKVIPKTYGKYYVYQQLSAYVINFVKMAEARKTTMGHITTDHLEQSRIALPPEDLVSKFETIVSPLFEKITMASEENRELTALRDFLLPMLMSGQVSIRD